MAVAARTVLILGTLDTKGDEVRYVRDLVVERGHRALVVDCGVMGDPPFEPDVGASRIAEAGGASLEALRAAGDRGAAVERMIAGLREVVAELHREGRFDGVLGLGGGGGTALATAAMRELPVGVPKVVVSTMASGDVAPYVGEKDVTMMYSVVDIAGLNALSRRILANAAGAVCGMVEQETGDAAEAAGSAEDRPLIAATMFGVTTPCVEAVRRRLEEAGYGVVVFHATGSGGRAMEGLIDDGWFAAVADLTTTEWCDEVVGGVLSAGPDRLSAAGRAGLPQVVSVGALDMVNFGGMDTVPERFRDRTLYRHNPSVTLMRTTPDECRAIGRRIAEKLRDATGPTVLMLPLRGVSMIDAEGQPFHDPEADRALFDALREGVGAGEASREDPDASEAPAAGGAPPSSGAPAAHVEVVEVDAHINDAAFAEAVAQRLLGLLSTVDPEP